MIPDPLGDAVAWLRDGSLLAYPTETVWGLGADAASEAALARLHAWKGRETDSPIAILVHDDAHLEALGFEVDERAARLGEAFWPGPLTLVLRCRPKFAAGVARDDGAVGVRCSSHPLARSLARRLEREGMSPITATSLNRSGQPPVVDREQARAVCGEDPDVPRLLAIATAEAGGDSPSTVVDLTGAEPRVLRWGALPADELDPVLRDLAAP